MVRKGTVTLNLFHLQGDTVYFYNQEACNFIKLAVGHSHLRMDVLGWWLCVSLALWELAKCTSSHFYEFLSWKAQEKWTPRTDGSSRISKKKVKLKISTFLAPFACLLTLNKHCGFSWPCKFAFNLKKEKGLEGNSSPSCLSCLSSGRGKLEGGNK